MTHRTHLESHLRKSIALALALGLASCKGATSTGPSQLVGAPPADLAAVCATDPLDNVSLDQEVDFMALRQISDFSAEGEDLWTSGVACETATDMTACEDELANTWPTRSGWGYCGEGCSDIGVVTTVGDVVALYDSTDEVITLLGDIDTPADAIFVAESADYTPRCDTMVETTDGAYRFEATLLVSDCPWTESLREIEVSVDGTITMLREVELDESNACAGRLPAGIEPLYDCNDEAVAARLAEFAWLEGAAVVAFEHLAEELSERGAPAELVSRARAAAADEVRHAETLTAFAHAAGAVVPEVVVAPRQARSLLEFALHNAQEGCVRETFGVVDAAFRAERAPNRELRDAFAVIAEDETRHAALSWDIARWLDTRLTPTERAQVRQARQSAHQGLLTALDGRGTQEVGGALGGPDAAAAKQMAEVLYAQLAA